MQQVDADLLAKARQFDKGALAWIFDQYSPAVNRYAWRMLGSLQLAEDCTSDVFLRFLDALHAGKGPQDNLKAYLFRSAHNWVIDHYRSKAAQETALPEEVRDSENSLEANVETTMRIKETLHALETLKKEQREVVLLKYVEGMDNQEIARVIHKPVGAVKALLHRAVSNLRKEFNYEA